MCTGLLQTQQMKADATVAVLVYNQLNGTWHPSFLPLPPVCRRWVSLTRHEIKCIFHLFRSNAHRRANFQLGCPPYLLVCMTMNCTTMYVLLSDPLQIIGLTTRGNSYGATILSSHSTLRVDLNKKGGVNENVYHSIKGYPMRVQYDHFEIQQRRAHILHKIVKNGYFTNSATESSCNNEHL